MAVNVSEFEHGSGTIGHCRQCGTGKPGNASFCVGCGSPFENGIALQSGPQPVVAAQPWQAWLAGLCALLATSVLPPLLGGVALFLGFQTKKWNRDLGNRLITAAVACTAVGMVLGALMVTSSR